MGGRLVASILLAVLIAAILLALIGPATLAASLQAASWGLVAIALSASLAFFALRGLRWSLLLRSQADVSPPAAALLSAVGWMVSSFVPLKAGDAVRTTWMARRTRTSLAQVAGSAAVERALDVLGLAVAATLALGLLAWQGTTGPPWMVAALAVAWLLPILALAALLLLARLLPSQRRRGRLIATLGAGIDALPELARRPRRLAAVAGLTLLITAAQLAVHLLLIVALMPHAPILALAAGAPLFALTFAIPLTPAHVGTYEAGFVAAFALAGIPAADLLPVALASHVLALAMMALVGTAALALLWRDPARRAAGKESVA